MIDFTAAITGIRDRLATIVSRGKLALAGYSPTKARTMVQLKSLGGTLNNIELLLPYGMSAMPVGQTADLLIFKINNLDHKVAIGADDPACRITDLQAGEFGFQDNQGQQVVFRRTGVVVSSPTKIRLTAPTIQIHATSELAYDCDGNGTVYKPSTRDDYVTGSTNTSHALNPPEVPD